VQKRQVFIWYPAAVISRRLRPVVALEGRHPKWGTVTEGQLLEFVTAVFKRNGYLVYHTYDSRGSERGFPDIVAVRPPVVVFAELKDEFRNPTVPSGAGWCR
jgi:hypothetical protein